MILVGVAGSAGAGKDEVSAHLVEKHHFAQVGLADPIKRLGLNVFGFDKLQLWGPSSARNAFDPRFQSCEIRSKAIAFQPGCNMSAVRKACDAAWGESAVRLEQYAPGWVHDLVHDRTLRIAAVGKLYEWFASLGHHYAELSPRIMLQHLGTEYGRQAVHKDVWVDMMIHTAARVLQGDAYTREEGFTGEKVPPPHGVVVSDVRFTNELQRIQAVGGKLIKVTRAEAAKKARTLGIASHASETESQSFSDNEFDAILANEGTLPELFKAVDVVAAVHLGTNVN